MVFLKPLLPNLRPLKTNEIWRRKSNDVEGGNVTGGRESSGMHGLNAKEAPKVMVAVTGLKNFKDNKVMVCRWVGLLFCALLSRILIFPLLSQLQDTRRSYQWMVQPILDPVVPSRPTEAEMTPTRRDKFLEVPQIIWGLNNQKIAVARAALTARKLNRTLVVPSLSASLFYKETDRLERMGFDQIFSVDRFNSLCDGFVRLDRPMSDGKGGTGTFVVKKGNGRRWTAEKDMEQLNECMSAEIDNHRVIKFEGKHPFLWHDHWPVRDYARVFQCLVLVDNLSAEVSTVVSKLRGLGSELKLRDITANYSGTIRAGNFSNSVAGVNSQARGLSEESSRSAYVAVHMRVEKDWMIHCKKLEARSKLRDGRKLRICSSKEEIIDRVARIPGLERSSVVYLAVGDALLEDRTLLDGWSAGLVPYEKKKLGVVDIYSKYPYLVQSAIDYEVCLQADIFVGNSFSTFSSLIVLERTMRLKGGGFAVVCADSNLINSYAYNLEDDMAGPQRWVTNMADLNLSKISYGTNEISCQQQ